MCIRSSVNTNPITPVQTSAIPICYKGSEDNDKTTSYDARYLFEPLDGTLRIVEEILRKTASADVPLEGTRTMPLDGTRCIAAFPWVMTAQMIGFNYVAPSKYKVINTKSTHHQYEGLL